jgi:hypothetical protein
MLIATRNSVASIMLILCMPVTVALAEDEAPGRWGGTLSLGVVSWSDLGDLEPDGGGSFDSLGYGILFSGHRTVARWGSADVRIGADLAVWGTESSIQGIRDDFTQRGLYLTPSMRFLFGDRNARNLSLEIGAGWYKVDFAELDCDTFGCPETQELSDEDAFGGYVGINSIFGRWFLLEFQMHFADFGEVTGFGADTGSLKGPFYMLNFGLAFGG